MTVYTALDHKVTINGDDFTDHLVQVEVSQSVEERDRTTMGAQWRQRMAGLKDASITLSFLQDFGAGQVDAKFAPLLGSYATCVVTHTTAAVGTANPSYTGVFLVTEYSPFSSQVGDIATVDVTWPLGTGTVARATS